MKCRVRKCIYIFIFLCVSILCNGASIDFSKDENWAVKSNKNNYDYDIFYIYPTVIFEGKNGKMNFLIKEQRNAALANSFAATALMRKHANVYAPFYRQADLKTFAPFKDFSTVKAKGQCGIKDVEDAFLYYMKHLNNNRPFIIFAHSQGSMVGFEILKKYFNNPKISKKFVAAYLSGMLLEKEELKKYPFLKFTQNKLDTGVILVWNLQSSKAPFSNFFVTKGALGVNPGNWRIDSQISPYKKISNWKIQPRAVLNPSNGATIIELETPEKFEIKEFGKGVYHTGNLSLFMNSINENMKLRINSFKNR